MLVNSVVMYVRKILLAGEIHMREWNILHERKREKEAKMEYMWSTVGRG